MLHINSKGMMLVGSKFFGELPMTFQKNVGQVMGLITTTIDGEVRKYVLMIKDMRR